MKRYFLGLVLPFFCTAGIQAQKVKFSQPHGFCDQPFELQITTSKPVEATIRYTLDGSEPTSQSAAYTVPLAVSGTTIIRAAAIGSDGAVTPIATATYLFMDDVLSQSNTPEGYPDKWGKYTEISGTATADYEMDPEMTNDPVLRPKIAEGLKSLPVLSIVTDKDNLFSHENDEERGGIYIYTGPPVGDPTGKSWTRPVSAEMFSADQSSAYDFSVTCGLRIHGGHGRLAEKNPKHSLRLVFKEEYGEKNLKQPLFGEGEPSKFKQLVLRCHFGNSWQHWSEGNRQVAQYTRDVWARRMQRKMGRTSVNALYVHLFLNGMYWGMYNIAERVDGQYGENHLGGDKDDMDVVKIEEEGGNHHEAAEGDLVAWEEMVQTVARAADDTYYAKLDTLLDIDAFIDYMLINQYAGNTDWDHHNWYAIRRRGADSKGFRFLCWDSEIIFENPNENVLRTHNVGAYPTGIFNCLMQNKQFATRYLKRAKEVLADDGLLGEKSVVAVWDSLYHVVETAIYAEAARWGDYRRDVHLYQSPGQLYTVDNHYMAERNRLLTQYFPVRTNRVLNAILDYVDIDDFEAPADWTPLTASMFHLWDGTGIDAQPLDTPVGVDWQLGVSVGGGEAIAGGTSVAEDLYADLSQYDKLVLRGNGNGLRILANRLVAHGPWKQIVVSFNEWDSYWDSTIGAIVLPLDDLRTVPTTDSNGGSAPRTDAFVHLNAMKVDWGNNVKLSAAYLVPKAETSAVPSVIVDTPTDNRYYNLNGQQVQQLRKGIYVRDGKKVIVK